MSGIFLLGWGMKDNTALAIVGERQEEAGGGGDAQPLTLLESESQHAAVTTATVTCRPTAGARLTTARAN